jgi:hypothetical protein
MLNGARPGMTPKHSPAARHRLKGATMHLITDGMVKVGKDKGPGKLVLTDRSIFVLKSATEATSTGSILGGLVGALIGQMIDRNKAKKDPPAHLDDPEIVELGDKTRRALLTTRLLAKLPLNGSLSIKPTRLGFEFAADGHPPVSYGGFFHKKKIMRFLETRSIHVDPA